jgi:Domain of unknown function (DUF222)
VDVGRFVVRRLSALVVVAWSAGCGAATWRDLGSLRVISSLSDRAHQNSGKFLSVSLLKGPKLSHPPRHTRCMELGPATKIIGDLCDLRFGSYDKDSVLALLSVLQKWRGMLDAVEIDVAKRLHELSITAPADLAAATQRHNRSGNTVFERAATIAGIASLAEPLRAGALHGAHVDAVTGVLRTVRDEHAETFHALLPQLIDTAVAKRANPDEFARMLGKQAREIERDGGEGRFEQQRRETSLRTWTDKRTGMFRLSGSFDPLSGVVLHGRLQAAMAALFAEKTPSSCPTDPGLKADHLRAIALLSLTSGRSNQSPSEDVELSDEWSPFMNGGPARFGRPEVVVVLDARQATVEANNGVPVVDWGLPVELPQRAFEELFERADVHPVITMNGVVLFAPGEVNLGRSTRLANRAQRRALRALYATCAVPGCAVKFDHCQPHHVWFWEHGGPTDLANLLPLCSRHHHLMHEGGWKLSIDSDRVITIAYPDGAIQTTGPPGWRLAA